MITEIPEYPVSRENNLKLDYLIISGNPKLKIEKLKHFFDFNTLIFDSSNSSFRCEKWERECKKNNIPFYNVCQQGAFVTEL